MIGFRSTLPAALAFCAVYPGGAKAESLEQTLARMDKSADGFKSMKANVRHVSHLNVINEDTVSIGTTSLKRTKRDVRILVHFTSPDDKSVGVSGTKVEMYLPKLQTVQEYNVSSRDMVEKYLALGFGASGSDLKSDYDIKAMGDEIVGGEKAARLELTPKTKQVRQQFPTIELWISETKGYPVQEKFHQSGGDYMLITYSDIVINPSLPDSEFKLTVPKGVKRVFPQK
jgi:outer membrane lipoprotein-sorting protein